MAWAFWESVSVFMAAPSTVGRAKAIACRTRWRDMAMPRAVAEKSWCEMGTRGGHGFITMHEHLLHQCKNQPWAALYVGSFFTFFHDCLADNWLYAIHRASASWLVTTALRVLEGSYGLFGGQRGIVVFVILAMSVAHMNHLFVWMDPESGRTWLLCCKAKPDFLNGHFTPYRAAIFLGRLGCLI